MREAHDDLPAHKQILSDDRTSAWSGSRPYIGTVGLRSQIGMIARSAAWSDSRDNLHRVDDSIVRAAAEVVVIAGFGYDPRHRQDIQRLANERDADRVADLAALLADVREDSNDVAMMELPSVSLVFLRDRRVLAEIGLLAGSTWVREAGQGDHRLVRPDAVRQWLEDLNVHVR